jgi:hypothetical protein
MNAGTSGQIIEDYNLLVAVTPRTNVTAGAHSISDGSYAPLMHFGQERLWGSPLFKPVMEPMQSSPLLGFGSPGPATDNPVDLLGLARPAGIASPLAAVGALERHNNWIADASPVGTGSSPIQFTGPGDQAFVVPVPYNVALTAYVLVRWDSAYSGTKPQLILDAQPMLGIAAATATAVGSANVPETLAVGPFTSTNPNFQGQVVIRVRSNDKSGSGQVEADDFNVSTGTFSVTEASEAVSSRLVSGTSIYPRSAAYATASIIRDSWEPRPDNADENATMGSGSVVWGPDATSAYWLAHTARVAQVGGQFTGTTTECISWAATRWGINEDVLRAVCVQESDWHMSTIGDVCGPVGEASYGISQIKNRYCGGPDAFGGYPYTAQSTALNLDFWGSWVRTVYDGYFYDGGAYLYGGLTVQQVADVHGWDYVFWGAIGSWFSGDWYDAGAISYIASVQSWLAARTWESY